MWEESHFAASKMYNQTPSRSGHCWPNVLGALGQQVQRPAAKISCQLVRGQGGNNTYHGDLAGVEASIPAQKVLDLCEGPGISFPPSL